MKREYFAMLMTTGFAGGLSGILWLVPNGLMGVALGMSLAAGAIWLGERQKKQGGVITARQIWQAGFGSGILAGILMAAISGGYHQLVISLGIRHELFGPPVLPFWNPLMMGVLYGTVVQWGYATRLSSPYPFMKALFWTCLGCILIRTAALTVYPYTGKPDRDFIYVVGEAVMYSLIGAVPFAFLWVVAMWMTDPAWLFRPTQEPAS